LRISAENTSPFYKDVAVYASVFLDNVKLKYVTEVCDDEGWADVVVTEPDGNIVVDESDPANPKAAIKRITGNIRIEIPEELRVFL
jgi:predicted membrane protein